MFRISTWKTGTICLLMLMVFCLPQSSAYPTGITGSAVDYGCSCHGEGTAADDVQVTWYVEGDWSVGSSLNITLSATSDVPGSMGGLNVQVNHGTLVAIDDSTQVIDGELTHTEAGTSERSWTFAWEPSTSSADLKLEAYVNTVDGDGNADADDHWAFSTHVEEGAIEIPPQIQNHGAGTGSLIWKGIGAGFVICFFILRWKPATGSLANREGMDDGHV